MDTIFIIILTAILTFFKLIALALLIIALYLYIKDKSPATAEKLKSYTRYSNKALDVAKENNNKMKDYMNNFTKKGDE
tara:strand:- start:15 stop:248 length:234 start_codon:yes stop_codon:yes gene_type:complete